MKINIAKIKQAKGLSQTFLVEENGQDFAFDGEMIKFLSPIKVKCEITNTGEIFTVNGSFETRLGLQCGRCLEEFVLPMEVAFDAAFALQSEDEEIRLLDGDEIILDEIINEALLLDLPLKFLCNEECKGLCPQCGCNQNEKACFCSKPIDPRLGVLAELLKDKPKGV